MAIFRENMRATVNAGAFYELGGSFVARKGGELGLFWGDAAATPVLRKKRAGSEVKTLYKRREMC